MSLVAWKEEDVPRSLTEAVFSHLRQDILTCRLAPNSRLKIGVLCERFGASLGAVREALSRLSSEGLVVSAPQRGYRVAPISPEDFADLTRTRIKIEGMALRDSIAHGDIAWEGNVVAALHQMSRLNVTDPGSNMRINEDWAAAHADFHHALISACSSAWLLRLRQSLFDHSERYRLVALPYAASRRNLEGEHEALAEASVQRNTQRASRILTRHIREPARHVLQAFDKLFGEKRAPVR